MGREALRGCMPLGDSQGSDANGPAEEAGPREVHGPDASPFRPMPSEVVVVPVQAIVYLQAMAENGQADRPKPLGPALPCGHVRYRQ